MTVTLSPDLEAALREQARRRGVTPEELALDALRERFRGLLGAARPWGVSLPDTAVSSEGLYD